MKEKTNDNKELTIKIKTTQGIWENTFDKTAKIQEVLQAVIRHFNFAESGNYELRLDRDPNQALKPERPLVSYGIQDGEVLVFTDLGVAV